MWCRHHDAGQLAPGVKRLLDIEAQGKSPAAAPCAPCAPVLTLSQRKSPY